MRIAYLINQYPSISHTFVRREIESLEDHGVHVDRFSARQMAYRELPDARDRSEGERTHALLGHGAVGLLAATLRTAKAEPSRFARALLLSLRIGRRSDRGHIANLAYLLEACVLVEQMKRADIHHVHAHFGTNPAAIAMLARELSGCTYSFTVHGPEEFDKPDLIALCEKIARAAFVVGVSSFGRSQLFRHCESDVWKKVHVVRCGLDNSYLEAALSPVPDVPKLVCVGRLCEQKGQLLLVEAAAQLRSLGKSFELVLVGDGELRPQIERRVAELGLEQQVRLTGWASGEEVQRQLRSARALVLPSFAEGLPVVLMEALASARPVICTQVAGVPELVSNGETGWLVPAGSVEALTGAMREALERPTSELSAMGQRGRKRVADLHDASRSAAQLARLFERYALPGKATLTGRTRSDVRGETRSLRMAPPASDAQPA